MTANSKNRFAFKTLVGSISLISFKGYNLKILLHVSARFGHHQAMCLIIQLDIFKVPTY
jgi:hypothetical protein